jgi:hypothetical protein
MEPHELDTVSLAAGLIFLALGLSHLLGLNVTQIWPTLGRLVPLLVIIGGAVLLLRVLRRTNDS